MVISHEKVTTSQWNDFIIEVLKQPLEYFLKITEWPGSSPLYGQVHLPPEQVAPSPIQPPFQGWSIQSFSGYYFTSASPPSQGGLSS